jgi:16S rRNA (cytosine967-C5)-methyltransferase
VCSTEPEETQGVIKSFLKDRPDFVIDEALMDVLPSLRPLLDHQGRLQALPHRHGTDGFFAVRLRRRQRTNWSANDADERR